MARRRWPPRFPRDIFAGDREIRRLGGSSPTSKHGERLAPAQGSMVRDPGNDALAVGALDTRAAAEAMMVFVSIQERVCQIGRRLPAAPRCGFAGGTA